MPVLPVRFFTEGIRYTLRNKRLLASWIDDVIRAEGGRAGSIRFIFVTDDFLHEMNRNYLQHDTLTDVITFNLSDVPEAPGEIDGEVYMSLERIRENAGLYHVTIREEIRRVMVHGVLHLLGYGDSTPSQRLKMKEKEDYYLSLPSANC